MIQSWQDDTLPKGSLYELYDNTGISMSGIHLFYPMFFVMNAHHMSLTFKHGTEECRSYDTRQ